MSKSFIAYTRVSTARQSTDGVSLTEQKQVISDYASKHQLSIVHWYEEQQSAAKHGRPVFDQVLDHLRTKSGEHGLVLHKVDRGARNLRDWASIGEAIDLGVDVRLAGDDFDLSTRGGRLAADIQAVIAADYIRNLREEVKKGIQGRLRQGLFPQRAPRGYLDCGSGRVKQPDPIIAPIVIAAFERYATGKYSLYSLAQELAVFGLRTQTNKPLSPDALSRILHNPFYVGNIRMSGRIYQGIHQPLIDRVLFSQVAQQLKRRSHPKLRRHQFTYQGQLRCRKCQRLLTGEQQKQHTYYRCHRCSGVSVREDRVNHDDIRYSVRDPKPLRSYAKFESHSPSAFVG